MSRTQGSGCGDTQFVNLPIKGFSDNTVGPFIEKVHRTIVLFSSDSGARMTGTVGAPFLKEGGGFLSAVYSERNNCPNVAKVLEYFGFECVGSVYNYAHPHESSGKIHFYFLNTNKFYSCNPNSIPIPDPNKIKEELGVTKESKDLFSK